MLGVARQSFLSESEFDIAWQGQFESNAYKGQDPVSGAALFISGALFREGFRFFKNGGIPLAERREGKFVEEILIRPNPRDDGRFCVRVHLSHSGVREIRGKYWRPSSRAPIVIASGNIGELNLPPQWCFWDATAGIQPVEEVVDWISTLAIPWFDQFHRPSRLKGKLMTTIIPLIDESTTLELLLAEYGREAAADYLYDELRITPKHSGQIQELTGHSIAPSRIDAIAKYFRL